MFKDIIKYIFRNLGFELSRIGSNEKSLESLIIKYSNKDNEFFFVQVGANDGVRYDPIYKVVNKLNIKGVVIEPIKDYYIELVKNYYGNKNIKTVNKAIYSEDKVVTMFRVRSQQNLPDWSNGIASLDPNHYKKSNTPKESIVEEKVDAITFSTLFSQYSIKRVDFLQIDTEGYDYHIINLFPFDKFLPKLIHFEHSLSSGTMTYSQYDEVHSKLIRLGYKTIMNENDTICYLE